MRVHIGPYKNWFGPYQLAEALCFWVKDTKDEYGFKCKPHWIHQFGEWLAYGSILPEPQVGDIKNIEDDRAPTLLFNFLSWLHEKKKRKEFVKIDRWDSWNAESTLALVILPVLKQVRSEKHGAPFVFSEDVPSELRPTSEEVDSYNKEGITDDNWFNRWDWILDQMIYSFERIVNPDWENEFVTGISNLQFKKIEDGNFQMIEGPEHTLKVDRDRIDEEQKKIANGLMLFGKYYQSLWT